MVRASPVLLAALALAACAHSPPTPEPIGTSADAASRGPAWKPKSFTKLEEGCSQRWTCDCKDLPARSGCRQEGPRDDTTQGVCAADSGPVTGCDRCMALPPAIPCACHEVCR